MAGLSAEECRELADDYLNMATAVAKLRLDQWDELTEDERQRILSLQHQLMHYSSELTADAINATLAEIDIETDDLKTAVSKMKNAIKTVDDISKTIQIAAAAVLVGAAIATQNPTTIATSIRDAFGVATA
jgi:predicted translin family RNA/ssDNA-binding protein